MTTLDMIAEGLATILLLALITSPIWVTVIYFAGW